MVGILEFPGLDVAADPVSQPAIIGVDPEGRAVYTALSPLLADGTHPRYLYAHPLGPDAVGPPRRSAEPMPFVGNPSPMTAHIDVATATLSFIALDPATTDFSVLQIDTDTLTLRRNVRMATLLPGFTPMGLTFSSDDDRYYLVGEVAGGSEATNAISKAYGRPVAPGPSIVALESDLTVAWLRNLDNCPQVLQAFGAGALVARSATRPVLYTFCNGGAILGAVSTSQAASSGLVRLTIDPTASAADAAGFLSEFFPVSGVYSGGTPSNTGIAGFDPGSERVFVQSLSQSTPGAWVFGGKESAWMGFVAAPDANDRFLGINPRNGRYYLGGSLAGRDGSGYINVTDGRSTPVAQGQLFQGLPQPVGFIVPDPGSRRVFTTLNVGTDGSGGRRPVILIDDTAPIRPLEPVDYDALTRDLPDPVARTDYSGAVGGFGVRYELVGGVEGALSATGEIGAQGVQAAGLSFGDRSVTIAGVPSIDLRPGGAAASAAIAHADDSTGADLAGADQSTGGSGAIQFPYRAVSCLDGNSDRIEESELADDGSGMARVVCDLKARSAEAMARFEGISQLGSISVGASSFATVSRRDEGEGAVTEATAVAESVRLGEVTIHRVTAKVTTRSNGRPGTASVTYERRIDGVDTGDGSGPVSCRDVHESGRPVVQEGDCDAVAEQLNAALEPRIRVRFPVPQLTATPLGAFAGLRESETDYLNGLAVNNDEEKFLPAMELLVVNDSIEKSRVLVHFAAMRANTIFTRSPLLATGTPGDGPALPLAQPLSGLLTSSPVGSLLAGGQQPATSAGPPVTAASPEGTAALRWEATGLVLTVRSLDDGLLVVALVGLLLLPLLETRRRGRLLEILGGGDQ